MTIGYLESKKNYRARQSTCKTLGIGFFLFGNVFKKSNGEYCDPESRERVTIANERFRKDYSKIESIMQRYEIKLARVESGKARLNTQKTGKCKVCGRDYTGAYEACSVCLQVYHHKFRDSFLEHWNSGDALLILDESR